MLRLLAFFTALLLTFAAWAENTINIPILCYHNFNPTTPGFMNMTPVLFETQLKYLKDNGFTVIPLKEAVAYLKGERDSLPAKAVVITLDDGWQSVYKYAAPLIKKYNVPVTLFIYPQTISEGKNAMTWEELKELQKTGLFDIQGHTYDHPNFKQAKKRLSSENYEKYIVMQLTKSKKMLEEKLGQPVTLLAWPFGIYNNYLEEQAAKAGYDMSFTIDAVTANRSYPAMAQPRYMILQVQSMNHFAAIVNSAKVKRTSSL
jgi:peptidoglycan/xylan/chitin deacetylase (PgdA/CDA1 family)